MERQWPLRVLNTLIGETPMAKVDDLALVARMLRRVRTQYVWALSVTLALSVFAFLVWPGILTSPKFRDLFGGFGGPSFWIPTLIVVGVNFIVLCFAWSSWRVETAPLYLALRDHPNSVLWVFGGTTSYAVHGVTLPNPELRIVIYLDNGQSGVIRFIPSEHLDAVSAAVSRLAPSSWYGFTEENRHRYLETVERRGLPPTG